MTDGGAAAWDAPAAMEPKLRPPARPASTTSLAAMEKAARPNGSSSRQPSGSLDKTRLQGSTASLASVQLRSTRLALLSMLMLIVQGTALSILLRYSRVKAG